VFSTLAEARAIIEAWHQDYNQLRPHSSLGALTPSEFAALKREQTIPPREGEITGGLYLCMEGKRGAGHLTDAMKQERSGFLMYLEVARQFV